MFFSGAYDSAYRRRLRTSYPFCAWVLDILMDKEEEGVVLDEELVAAGASIFREDIMNMNSREVTPAHPVQREETKLDASTSDIPPDLKQQLV